MSKFNVSDRVKSVLNDRVPAYVVVEVKPRKLKVRPADYVPHDLDHWAPTSVFIAA